MKNEAILFVRDALRILYNLFSLLLYAQAEVNDLCREGNEPLIMNNYQKGWALRYLREAKAEFIAAQKTPYVAPGLIVEAMRKAQAAIYYSLGDPASVEAIVRQTTRSKQFVKDPILRCLVEIERTVRRVAQTPESDREKAFQQADGLIQIASDVVELFTGEKA